MYKLLRYVNTADVTNPVFLQLYFLRITSLQIVANFVRVPYQGCWTCDTAKASRITHHFKQCLVKKDPQSMTLLEPYKVE